MVFFKISLFMLSAIIAIGGLYLSKPNRPKLAFILSSLIIVLMLIGIVLEKIDAKDKRQEQDKVVAQNTTLSGEIKKLDGQNKELITGNAKVVAQNTELMGEIENLNDQNKELITGNAKVVAQNTELMGKIENLDDQNKKLIAGNAKVVAQNTELLGKIGTYQQDLREKNEKIEELEKKSKMAARGVTSTYDFNGAKRQTSAGRISVNVGEEFGIYQQMVDLEKSKNYPPLIKLCEQQINKTPDWYTLYFYLGLAQANTGLKDDAIENFRFVVDNTPGDPAYAEAQIFLEKLKQQP